MLRANGETGDVYGFLGEGGYVSFENINQVTGEAVLTIHGDKDLVKREFLFGQDNIVFSFTSDDIDKLGEGEHPYTLYTKGYNGIKNTLIPDPSNEMRPVFQIEA